jgi:hypothetical protein
LVRGHARGLLVAAVVVAALALVACGEKEENLTPSTDTTATTTTPTVPALEPQVVEARARDAASAKVARRVKIAPSAWSASCAGGEDGGAWTCHMRSGPCKGPVIVSPPSGPAEPAAITTDASGIRCAKAKS